MGQPGDLQVRHAQWLVGEPPSGVPNVVCSICVPLILSISSPDAHCPSVVQLTVQDPGQGEREKWAFWAASHTAGETGCSLIHSHFLPAGQITV